MGEVGEQAVRLENVDVVEAGVKGVKIVTGLKPGSNGDDGCYKQVGLSVNSRVIAVLNTLVSVTKIPHNHHHHDQPVIVADPFDLVVVHVQPFEALWDEGKVEPLRAIVDQMLIGQPQLIMKKNNKTLKTWRLLVETLSHLRLSREDTSPFRSTSLLLSSLGKEVNFIPLNKYICTKKLKNKRF